MSSTISISDQIYRKLLASRALADMQVMPGEPGWEVTGETIDAPANSSYIYGTEFNDSITLGEGCVRVYGKAGDDLITGTVASFVYGEGGNDRIELTGEAREIYGGDDSDIIVVGDKSRFIHGDAVDDVLNAGNDVITAGDDCSSIWGEGGDDVINVGDNARDVSGGPGNDHIIAKNGASSITGNEGDDSIEVGDDASSISGADGDDTITCGDNATSISGDGGSGQSGNDIIITGNNAYDILGNDGNDEIRVGDDSRLIDGGNGDDKITAGNFADTIRGQAGNDTITVGDNVRYVQGGAGEDTIKAGDNATNLQGGDDNDTIIAKDYATQIDGGYGDDIITAGKNATDINGYDGADTITVGDDADNIRGGNGDDKITAELRAKNVQGGPGNDEITAGDYAFYIYGDQKAPFASDGDDKITLGNYANLVYGEGGNDTITVGDFAATYYSQNDGSESGWGIYGGSGNDIMKTGTDCRYIYGESGEDTIETDSRASFVYGGEDNDTITAGNNSGYIYGDGGDDKIYAADGAYSIYGGAGNDRIEAGKDIAYVYGEEGDDYIELGNGAKIISGGTGNDIIKTGNDVTNIDGGDGNDVITAGDNCEWIFCGLGEDSITVGKNAVYISCADGPGMSEDSRDGNDILISNYVDQITNAHGSGGNDIIIGNVNTPSLELLSAQNIESFEILLRALDDDVLHLDLTSHERLAAYGITVNPASSADAVMLSDAWSLSAEKTNAIVDVFTSFQNGVTLELEILNEKEWEWKSDTTLTVSEKDLGKASEITIADEGYYLVEAFDYCKLGHVEEADGKWYYVLDQAIDSGPIAGANAVEKADFITVHLKNEAGHLIGATIPVTIIDDTPEITISEDQSEMTVYISADGYAYNIFINDRPWDGIIDASTTQVQLEGDYGTLTLTLNPDSVSGTKEPLWFTGSIDYASDPNASESGTDLFTFRLFDGDGDVAENSVAFTSEVTLPDSSITGIDQLTFLEQNLFNGSAPDYMQLVKNGKLTYDMPTGLSGLTIAHDGESHVIPDSSFENIITEKGIFSVWHEDDAIAYSFILSDPVAGKGADTTLAFEAILKDGAGRIYSGNNINIHIVDDSPRILETKTWTVDSANPEISGNAGDYFLAGADGGVFSWKMDESLKAEVAKYGDLALESDGSYSFALNTADQGPDGPLALIYGFTDSDGDSITGNIYIDIA